MSCATLSGCRLGSRITGGLITLKIHLCNCIREFSEAYIHDDSVKCWASSMISSAGSYSWQFLEVLYVPHMPLVGCWRRVYYILFLMFCGPGRHSGYSNYLWASLGCGIYHPPLSSTEIKESVELYLFSPCRPWIPVVGWNIFFTTF